MAANPSAILGIPQVATTVPDLADAIAFYERDLGLPLLFKTGTMAVFACGSTRLMIATPEQNPTKQTTFVYFGVGDIQRARADLARKGVRFREEPHAVGRFNGQEVWLASFVDPGGNILHITSEVPVAATAAHPKTTKA